MDPESNSAENDVWQFKPSDGRVMTVKEMSADDQPRERLKKYGVGSLSNAELFAIILRTGTRGYPITTLCRDLMESSDNSFKNLERASRQQIMQVNGIGELKAMQIEACMEIVRRYAKEGIPPRVQIKSSQDIYEYIRYDIGNLPHEEMWVIYLTNSLNVIGAERVSEGGLTATVVDIKKILRAALLSRAQSVVLCHNHPSGVMYPSGPDDAVTRRAKDACTALELRLLDHLIVTANGYYSYRDSSSIL